MRRAALLIRCSTEDAANIRRHAAIERRTVSGYVLYLLDRSLRTEDRLWHKLGEFYFQRFNSVLARSPSRFGGYKTTMLIRCTRDEASRIRFAARRRQITISDFITHSLHRFWTT